MTDPCHPQRKKLVVDSFKEIYQAHKAKYELRAIGFENSWEFDS